MPYLLDKPGLGHHVQGEVYQVDDDMLALLGTIHILRNYVDRILPFFAPPPPLWTVFKL